MNALLQPLSHIPGVELAMLVTHDGVPIEVTSPSSDGREAGREEALAAIATGWMREVVAAVGPLSWTAPHRIVLRAARATLVMQEMRRAVLLVWLRRGMSAEDVRLSMEGTMARIERSLRSMGARTADSSNEPIDAPPGPLPNSGGRAQGQEEFHKDLTESRLGPNESSPDS